jgi:hypothetical protein
MFQPAKLRRRVAKSAACACFVAYLGWNAWWLAHGRIPPSILLFVTGLPSPTTGGIRSLHALLVGHVGQSLRFNPLTVVYIALLAVSAAVLLRQCLQRRPLALPNWTAWSWFGALALGWAAKFALGPAYW